MLFKQSLDLWFYLLGGQGENELLLNAGFVGFLDALGLLFRGQVEKRALVDALDLVVLALDETFDDGYVSFLLSFDLCLMGVCDGLGL